MYYLIRENVIKLRRRSSTTLGLNLFRLSTATQKITLLNKIGLVWLGLARVGCYVRLGLVRLS